MKPGKRKATKATCSCCPPPPAKNSTTKSKTRVKNNVSATITNINQVPSTSARQQSHAINLDQAGLDDNISAADNIQAAIDNRDDPTGQQQVQNAEEVMLPLLSPPHIDDDTSSDEESIGDDFLDIVNNHTHSMLSGNGTQFVEPINSPIINQVKNSIRKAIWKNKFIDMAVLLPNTSFSHTQAQQFTLQMDQHSNISVQPVVRPRRITSIEAWTSAFIRFVAVYTAKFPHESPALMKYLEVVRDIATRHPGQGFLLYDTQFRMLRQSVPLPWDHIHTEYWLMACTSVQQPTAHSFRSPRQFNRQFTKPRLNLFVENTCWNYNKRTQCHNSKCTFPHICGFCRGQHTAFNCRFTSKEQAAKAFASKPSSNTKSNKPLPPSGHPN